MPDVLSSDDLEALAAEYVLGTLDPEERKGATALLEVDHAFRGTVRIWERRLSELHLMVEPVEPDPKILARIKAKIGGVEQIPISEEAPLPQPLPAEPEALDEPKPAEAEVGEPKPAEAEASEAKAAEGRPAEAKLIEPATPTEAKPSQATPTEAKPTEADMAEPKPAAESAAPAIVEVAWPESEPKPPTPVLHDTSSAAPAEETPARPPEPPPRPATVSRRGSGVAEAPKLVEAGRGWKITTILATLVALALAALIGAWRFYPERLPSPLRATTVLKLPEPPPPLPPPPRRPPLPPFDE